MTKVPQRDPKRDKALIKDYKANMLMLELNIKYKVSSARIYQILDHYEVPRNRPKKK